MIVRRPVFVNAGILSILLLLLIVARCLAAILRLEATGITAVKPMNVYVIGALAALLSASVATVLQAYGRQREIVALTVLTVIGLLVFKLVAG